MLVIPAIDIKNGKVVRLIQGKYDETIYSDNPISVAKKWKDEGAKILHIVDLDAAVTGQKNNLEVVEEIASKVNIPIQFGGGLRNRKVIKEVLGAGISKVIIGTKAIDEQFLKSIMEEFKDKILVSIDEYNFRFITQGWQKSSGFFVREMIHKLADFDVKTIIYTDISRDGTMHGPNLERIVEILAEWNMSLIVSGGISSIADIIALGSLKPKKPYGVIIGKALYEGKLKLKEAMEIAGQ